MMNEEEKLEFLMHNDCVSYFTEKQYANIFTKENITSKKKALNIGDNKYYGYYLEKGLETYFVIDDYIDKLPFRELASKEIDFKNDVITVLTKVDEVEIPSALKMSLRELINMSPGFKHSNQLHYLLFKLCIFASYMDRVNFRASTDAGFGKDSVAGIIQGLVNSTANLYGATFAKLEFVLKNKLIILNEMGNLKGEDKGNMQEFLLATGGLFNTYTKRSRKSNHTQEQYDISALSLVIFYNLPEYYTNKGQEYFDQMFTKAVTNRFIPFVFDGKLTTKFETMLDVEDIVGKYDGLYKNIIATIMYFKNNKIKDIKYAVPKGIVFEKELMRYSRNFNTILKYVAEYAENQEEFNMLSTELYKCYLKYEDLITGGNEKLKFE